MSFGNSTIFESAQIAKNVSIGNGCVIGNGVRISDFCIIHDNVQIGDNSYIGPFCIIGEQTKSYYDDSQEYGYSLTQIGESAIIRSHSIIYTDVRIGKNFQTGHRVTIREKSEIGDNVRIGTSSDIQGFCIIGNYVNIHSSVIVGQKSVIEDYVWLFPHVILTNDPNPPSLQLIGVVIRKYAVVASACTILPGVEIGEGAVVGAHSLVKRNVSPGILVSGNPARDICPANKIIDATTGGKAYPWQKAFGRGMPWEDIGYDEWLEKEKGKN